MHTSKVKGGFTLLVGFAALCAALTVAAGGGASAAPTETVLLLYSFTASDGANPYAGLITDSAGNLYGTTGSGGGAVYGGVGGVQALAERDRDGAVLLYGRQRRGPALCRPDCRQQRQSLRHDQLGGACVQVRRGVQALADHGTETVLLLLHGRQRRGSVPMPA